MLKPNINVQLVIMDLMDWMVARVPLDHLVNVETRERRDVLDSLVLLENWVPKAMLVSMALMELMVHQELMEKQVSRYYLIIA